MSRNILHRRLDLLEDALVSLAALTLPADSSKLSAEELRVVEHLRATLAELEELREPEA